MDAKDRYIRSLIIIGRDLGMSLDELRVACNAPRDPVTNALSLHLLSDEQLRQHRDRLEKMLSPEARARRTEAVRKITRDHRRAQRTAPGAVRNASPAQRKLIADLIGQLSDRGALTTSERVANWLQSKGYPRDWQRGAYTTHTASDIIGALKRWLAALDKQDRAHDARAAGGNRSRARQGWRSPDRAHGGNGAPRPSAVSTEP